MHSKDCETDYHTKMVPFDRERIINKSNVSRITLANKFSNYTLKKPTCAANVVTRLNCPHAYSKATK